MARYSRDDTISATKALRWSLLHLMLFISRNWLTSGQKTRHVEPDGPCATSSCGQAGALPAIWQGTALAGLRDRLPTCGRIHARGGDWTHLEIEVCFAAWDDGESVLGSVHSKPLNAHRHGPPRLLAHQSLFDLRRPETGNKIFQCVLRELGRAWFPHRGPL